MSRQIRITPHLTLAEVEAHLKAATQERQRNKWLVIYNAMVDPRPAEKIALHTATSLWFVHHTISDYNRLGPSSIAEDRRGKGRNRAYLSWDEEVAFLATFGEQATAGHIVTVSGIKEAFEARVGHGVQQSTVYDLLHRHGWRTLRPRPVHPERDKEAQDAFKKNSRRWLRRRSQRVRPTTPDPSS